MPDPRERAWREQPARLRDATPKALSAAFRELFDAGWDAAKREDEQRIAALVAAEVALRELLNIHTKCVSRNEETGELNVDPLCTLYYDLQIHLDGGSYPQWRALANRTEAERGGTD